MRFRAAPAVACGFPSLFPEPSWFYQSRQNESYVLWLAAGGFAGWVGFRFIGANVSRGLLTSMVIGVCGAYLGGSALAPLLGDAVPMTDAFCPLAPIMALACAAGCLTVGDMIFRQFIV